MLVHIVELKRVLHVLYDSRDDRLRSRGRSAAHHLGRNLDLRPDARRDPPIH
jgi:hypothetical protein